MTTKASAPGKIILLGEHAVVYGQPALAVPVEQVRAEATLEPLAEEPPGAVIIAAPQVGRLDHLADLPPDDPLAAAVRLVLKACGHPAPAAFRLTLRSDIPIAAGLGSGAAVSVAIIRAVGAFLGAELPLAEQSALAFEVENIHHGTPSGIDNTVITYAQPVYFVRGQAPEPIEIGRAFRLVIADSGLASPTAHAVGLVRQAYEADPHGIGEVFDAIGQLSRAGRRAISEGDLRRLGQMMTANHDLLRQLGVSTAELDRLVDAAHSAGAFGAKLSGGGLGGNVIALIDADDQGAVAAALLAAGAAGCITTRVEPT